MLQRLGEIRFCVACPGGMRRQMVFPMQFGGRQMTHEPADGSSFDELAYQAADIHFRHVSRHLPEDTVKDVAREVVRRLAFRVRRAERPDNGPSAQDIERFCAALLSRDEAAGNRFIIAIRREGVPAETIYLAYVAAAARRLGKLWERDRISFMDVTLASGRLYRIIRGLRHVIDSGWDDDGQKSTLFALVPQETHTLGIEIATDMFRREGWDVDLSVGETHEAIVTRTEDTRYQAIVVVAQGEEMLANLVRLVLALRITQPMALIVVAGNIVGQVAHVDKLVGADSVIDRIENAATVLRDMVDATS